MPFTPEDIEAMSPAIREEIQLFELQRYFARKRRKLYAETHKRGNGWPRVWTTNDPDYAYRRLGGALPG